MKMKFTPEEVTEIGKNLEKAWLAGLTPQERLKGLTLQERLEGLTPQQWLAGLKPSEQKEILAGFKPEEIENYLKQRKRRKR